MGSKEKLNIPVLNEVLKPVASENKEFAVRFKNSMRSNVPLLDLVLRFILKQKGKKIRPLIVLLSSKIAGEINDRTYRGAVLVELLHTATLVHDDVVDEADKRRGFPSINKIWNNKVAVLVGDYLLSKGLLLSVTSKDFDFLETVSQTVKRMSEGELLQSKKTRKLDMDEETYFKVISDKTASLIETCCVVGGLSVTDNTQYIDALRSYGNSLGLAFQIIDDILDFEGNSKLFGKPIGGDIKEKKITLPLIYALQNVDKKESDSIRKMIKKGSNDKDVRFIIDFIERNNGIKMAQEKAEQLSERAKESIQVFPESESKVALESLVEFVVKREN